MKLMITLCEKGDVSMTFFDYDDCDGGALKIMMMTTIMLVLMKSSVFDHQSDVSYVTSF